MKAHFTRGLLAAFSLLVLSACQTAVQSDVVTFHQEPLPMGESIKVRAANPEKEGSLEFRRYAELVVQHLRDIGYDPLPLGSDAPSELIAEFDYEISQGPTEVVVSDRRLYSRYHFHLGRFYDPFYFGLYDSWDPFFSGPVFSDPFFTDAQTIDSFVRRLELNIIDPEPQRERIFEGRVESVGPRSELPEVMPYMITAMFTNFPGESGVTKVVTIERDGEGGGTPNVVSNG